MKIKGELKQIERHPGEAPHDNVHQFSDKDGKMKGCHSVMLGDKLLPKGQNGIYYQINDQKGVKIFYSLNKKWSPKRKTVLKLFRKHRKAYKLGVAPEPHKVVEVELSVRYKGEKVKKVVLGIKVDHVAYPPAVWADYARGVPYDFNALDQQEHPLHNAAGYLAFKKKVKNMFKVPGMWMDCSCKLGDIVYDTNKKRWFLVDIS